jgi:signal transduction histidine kinase
MDLVMARMLDRARGGGVCRAADLASTQRPMTRICDRGYGADVPRRLDAVIALVLAAVVAVEALAADYDTPSRPVAAVLGVLIALPLAWRSRWPLGVTAASAAAFAALGIATDDTGLGPQTVLLPFILAGFTAGTHHDPRRARIGLAVLLGAHALGEASDLVVMGPLFAGIWWVGRLAENRRHMAEQLSERASVLELDSSEHARLAIAEERARIARELHDVVAHSVSVIVVQAGAERLALGDERPQTREALEAIERTGRHAMAEMRRLVGMLRTEDEEIALAPLPSLAHLDALAAHITRAGLPVTVEIDGTPTDLPPGIDISAYRIVQEALTNALKHAGPARARVKVRYGPGALEIEVADDGRGGSPATATGHGLTGMRERVAVYGGELAAAPRHDGGFAVRARLPLGGPA